MTKKTWNEFRTETFLKRLLGQDQYLGSRKWEVARRLKVIHFIETLLKNKISLKQIDIGDSWNSDFVVWINDHQYTRFAKNDYKLVLKRLKVE